jgi:thioredoxin-related protein
MKFLSLLLIGAFMSTAPGWGTDFEKARVQAAKDHKLVLLNFSGSDWCIPCIRMHEQIFEAATFKDFAATNLALVSADFPRLKKHALPEEQQKRNEALAEKYNSKGIFPLTLLLDAEGNILKTWEGQPKSTADQFIQEIKAAGHVAAKN